MYLQIMEQIERRVAIGDWPPGSKLPSIRALAVSLKVSVITVKRAYLELERLGVIITRQGQGSWINDELDVASAQRQQLESLLLEVLDLSRALSLTPQELQLLMDKLAR